MRRQLERGRGDGEDKKMMIRMGGIRRKKGTKERKRGRRKKRNRKRKNKGMRMVQRSR